jgi:hypothetical protein
MNRAITMPRPQQRQKAPLDQAVIKLIEALARAQAADDHAAEFSPKPAMR